MFTKKRIFSTRQLALLSILSAVLAPHINAIGGKDEQNSCNYIGTLNALLGFVLIFGSIWFAKFMYEQIATQQVAADMVSQAQIIMIAVPVIEIVIAAYSCGTIAFLALIEGYLKAIKEQGESYPSEHSRRVFRAKYNGIAYQKNAL